MTKKPRNNKLSTGNRPLSAPSRGHLLVSAAAGPASPPRTYDDGGLVDINHAPASALMTIPGMTPEQAERVVALRNDLGGFSSAEEVSALAELPPALTPRLAEHGIFLR
jgi:DNA uptake protein ComE-like DNA-binding protein